MKNIAFRDVKAVVLYKFAAGLKERTASNFRVWRVSKKKTSLLDGLFGLHFNQDGGGSGFFCHIPEDSIFHQLLFQRLLNLCTYLKL
jgi:hypothetical protein